MNVEHERFEEVDFKVEGFNTFSNTGEGVTRLMILLVAFLGAG